MAMYSNFAALITSQPAAGGSFSAWGPGQGRTRPARHTTDSTRPPGGVWAWNSYSYGQWQSTAAESPDLGIRRLRPSCAISPCYPTMN